MIVSAHSNNVKSILKRLHNFGKPKVQSWNVQCRDWITQTTSLHYKKL